MPQENGPEDQYSSREISKRLTELDELKNTFIALVSHELRTPVNLIYGYLELGLETLDHQNPDAREYFEKAGENLKRLNRVVEELTDFARLQREKPIGESSPLPIAETFKQTFTLLRPELEKKDIHLQIDIPASIRERAYDAESMLILFRNILSNAAKFSPHGSRLVVKAKEMDDKFIIDFHDFASPIPEGKRDSIFQDFRQLENYLTRRYEGMGLGLAVARRTARMLGGDILLNVRDDGNTFSIQLPKEKNTNSPPDHAAVIHPD